MIPEYKLYHGAVFSTLIDLCGSVSIQSLHDEGRSHTYVISDLVGLQIKHATSRLRPWAFTFHDEHLKSLDRLKAWADRAFVVLVCHTDGMACIPLDEAMPALTASGGTQSWLRADRKKREWYRIKSPIGELPQRYPAGLDCVAKFLNQATSS